MKVSSHAVARACRPEEVLGSLNYAIKISAAVLGINIVLFIPFALEASPRFVLIWTIASVVVGLSYLAFSTRRAAYRLRPVSTARWLPLALLADLLCEGSFLVLWRRWAGPPSHAGESLYAPYMSGSQGWFALVLLTVVLIPALEEIGWRGLLQGRLERTLGAVPAVLLGGITFAAVHFNGWAFPLLLLSGLLLGCASYWSGSVLPGIVLHGGWNAAMLLLEAADLQQDPIPGVTDGMLAVILIVSLSILLWTLRQLSPARAESVYAR